MTSVADAQSLTFAERTKFGNDFHYMPAKCCCHIVTKVMDESYNAIQRGEFEKTSVLNGVFPAEIADEIGRNVCNFRVSTYGQWVVVKSSVEMLNEIHYKMDAIAHDLARYNCIDSDHALHMIMDAPGGCERHGCSYYAKDRDEIRNSLRKEFGSLKVKHNQIMRDVLRLIVDCK